MESKSSTRYYNITLNLQNTMNLDINTLNKIYTDAFTFNPSDLMSQLFPKVPENEDNLDNIKEALANKIKQLPLTPYTKNALFEIDEFLTISNMGGKKKYIETELREIPHLFGSLASISKHILSLDCPLFELNELLSFWKTDNLINIEVLLSPGKHHFKDFINGYTTNSAIKQLTTDLSRVSATGLGKGEYLLSMFSERINKRVKGDLEIVGLNVEVKTNDGGSGRYTDHNVNPLPGYSGAVANFKSTWAHYINQYGKIPDSGLGFTHIYDIGRYVPSAKQNQYYLDIEEIISNLFPTEDAAAIALEIRFKRFGNAKQLYARANFNYYRHIKTDDDAVLYLDISTINPTSICFTSCDDLTKQGFRLHADTIYLITHDIRLPYPQLTIKAI